MQSDSKHLRVRHGWYWLVGFVAFLWLLIRSGANPKRLTYPCQQAVMPIAVNWLLALIAFVSGSLFLRRFTKFSGMVMMIAGVIWLSGSLSNRTWGEPDSPERLPAWEVRDPVSEVFVIDSIPPTTGSLAAGDSTVPDSYLSDPAMDALVTHLASEGVFLYKTALHPDGIVSANDIVLIKANFYFEGRNTTNTDRIKGLIWSILNHPSGFTGEVIVFENTQGGPIDQNDNNSDDPNQSILNVISTFRSKHYPVYLKNCTLFREVDGSEYSNGDYADCFIYDPVTKFTYPKFATPSGQHLISLRYGVWDSVTATYDSSRRCIVDFPVLKSHSMAGATIVIKNYVGVGTTADDWRWDGNIAMHYTYFWGTYALLARLMSVTFPRLSIVDATWTNINGPEGTDIVHTNKIIASRDPVAADWYSAKYVLTPIARDPLATNPDLDGGTYNSTLGNWTRYLQDSTNHRVTKDSAQISVYHWRWDPVPIQLSRFVATPLNSRHVRLDWTTLSETNNYGFEVQRRTSGQPDFATLPGSFTAGHGTTTEPHSYTYVDTTAMPGRLWYRLKQIDLDGTVHFTEPIVVDVLTNVSEKLLPTTFTLSQNYPNPFNPSTTIDYSLPNTSFVTLRVYDVAGRDVATLVDGIEEKGYKSVVWNASGSASGTYVYQLRAGGLVQTRKMLLLR
jgi:hypothetical protein